MAEDPQPPNLKATFKRKAAVFLITFATMFAATFAWTVSRPGSLNDPPKPWNVDGVFYDNIAFSLNHGEGFSVNLYAAPWRATYLDANEGPRTKGSYSWLMPVKGTGPTALRSPAYPFALAAIFQVSNHRYDVARIFGCAFTSLGLAMMLTFCWLRWGCIPAITSGATLVCDFSIMQSAGTIATESLAVLVFAFTFLRIVHAWEQPTMLRWSAAGFGFAALMLTRGIWSLGFLILFAAVGVCSLPMFRRKWKVLRWSHLAIFLATAMLVAMPWWIRNCTTTGHFTPFGTAGSCGFVAAYCDQSLANFGQWQPDVFNQNQLEVQKLLDMDSIRLADLEYLTGKESVRKTKAWCLDNWHQIPKLMLGRGISHWGFNNPAVPLVFQAANLWLVVIGLLGCLYCTGRIRAVFIVVLLLDSVLVMLTWEHLGRYSIPIRPLIHVGYGLAISAFLNGTMARFRKTDD